jgi:broad specificity phosphatase PhoE
MSRPEGLSCLPPAKQRIAEAILCALSPLDGLRSASIVGSFVDRESLTEISDIDTIAVFDALTPARFDSAVAAIAALRGDALGFPGRNVRVNATLGPLKFDDPGTVVVHLMLYDLGSHRDHVLKSPFTCLDWERSPVAIGARLRDLYPASRLGIGDFVGARRGLANYLADLQAGTLSYRRFVPDGERMAEVVDSMVLDARHAGEYACHIVRNLAVNALKLVSGENRFFDEAALAAAWREHLQVLSEWIPFYVAIRRAKEQHAAFPPRALDETRAFLEAFSTFVDDLQRSSLRLTFVRHAPTSLNDGRFLGRRDPPVLEAGIPKPLPGAFDFVHSSPLRRAMETARALQPGVEPVRDARLAEIDYGEAEGLDLAELRERFPHLAEAWHRGEDPQFPAGESTADVRRRLFAYLDTFPDGGGHGLVVTHNVVMRVLVAGVLGISSSQAYRLAIAHGEPVTVCRIGKRWVPDWPQATKARLLDSFVGWHGAAH